ncbi:MAG: thiol:disulfide interchange protein DsbA/DsbL, partial [Polaromonas sp.]
MQRREFSLSAASAAAAVLGASVLPASVQAQARAFKDGTDYLALDKPAPTEAPAGQVEVVEFFWYSCPHCNAFEPMFDAWAKKVPKDVTVRRAPVSFRPDFEPQQRLYYVLEGMGKIDELHKKVFNAIHVEKQTLNTA